MGNPKSFTSIDYSYLNVQCNNLLSLLRSSPAVQSGTSTPHTLSRQSSQAEARCAADLTRRELESRETQQGYWNEYDNGSEAGDANEPYTIYIDPDADDSFPGHKAVIYVLKQARAPFAMFKGWLSPTGSLHERRPLLQTSNSAYFVNSHPSSTYGTDTEVDEDGSSTDFPSGYETHYAFPSIADQKLQRQRESLLFHSTIGCFIASFLLLLVAGILIATGRHRLRVEVDAGVTVGVVAALFFATMGLSVMLCRWTRCGWIQRSLVAMTFLAVCLISGVLLVLVMGNTAGV